MLPSTATTRGPFLAISRTTHVGKTRRRFGRGGSRKAGSAALACSLLSPSLTLRSTDVLTTRAASEDTKVMDRSNGDKKSFYNYLNSGDLHRAQLLFDDIEDKDIGMFNRIIKAFLKNKESYQSWNYYKKLMSSGLEPDLITYSIMMHVCAVEKKLEKAIELWNEVESRDFPIDKVIFNSMIQTCMIVGSPDKAHEFLRLMMDRDIQPDVVTFNTMIGGYARLDMTSSNALEEVDALMLKMKEMKIDFNGGTYMSLMRLSLMTGDPEKAIRYIDELMERGFDLNSTVYCQLIDEYTRSYKGKNSRKVLEQCWRIYLDMEHRGIAATVEIFSSLLRLFVKWGQWRSAFGLMDLMAEKNYHVTAEIYSVLLEGLAYGKLVGREVVVMTRILMEELQLAKIPLMHQDYRHILNIFLDARDIDSARQHFQKMKGRVRVDTRDYDRFLRYYGDIRYTSDWESSYTEVLSLVEEMKEASLKLDLVSYSTVLKICAKCRKWDTLELFSMEMKENNLHAPIAIYNLILDACAKEAEAASIDRAWKYFNEMKDNRIRLNVITYTTMINVCVAAQDVKTGYQLLEEMKRADVQPNERTYSSLMHLAGDAGQLHLVYEVFEEMTERKVFHNAATYNVLISACGKAKEPEKVMQAYEDMKSEGIMSNISLFCTLIRALGLCERRDLIYTVFDEFRQKNVYLSHKAFELMSTTLKDLGDEEGAVAIQQLEKEIKTGF